MYDYATYDAGREAPGTRALWTTIASTWPASVLLGIYNARAIRGSDRLSLHAEGRAVDFKPPGQAKDVIAEWARTHAATLGIQEIIVYATRRIWTSNRSAEGWRPYKGVSSGMTHIHIGQHRSGAGIGSGKGVDPIVMASTVRDIVQGEGLRAWQAAVLGVIGLGLWAQERGHLRSVAHRFVGS
ncbi:MAG: hypothetical protein FGM24_04390 [Candidatus Kapabacteria bacterium]|nr:hypothetical protein [Candidatus Kapabacteria bacterium]